MLLLSEREAELSDVFMVLMLAGTGLPEYVVLLVISETEPLFVSLLTLGVLFELTTGIAVVRFINKRLGPRGLLDA